ncbi:MAG: DUF2779 domain-containing protein [Bacilli bacterium]|nr:DUF2779 domain-containing protein [Bacilli bacterium]
MNISKSMFKNLSRCKDFASIYDMYVFRNAHHIKEIEGVDVASIKSAVDTLEDGLFSEEHEKAMEIFNSIFDEETGEDLTISTNAQMEAYAEYFKELEVFAAEYIKNNFDGELVYSEDTKQQKKYEFSVNGNTYYCYLDIYLEAPDGSIKIFEVKATTTNKFYRLGKSLKKQVGDDALGYDKYDSIFYKDEKGILRLKENLDPTLLEDKKYRAYRNKMFDRFGSDGTGKYVYDIAVERYFIENSYKDKKPNIEYYLVVLNGDYIYDGCRDNEGMRLYNQNENGNDLITLVDVSKITEEFLEQIDIDRKKIEDRIEERVIEGRCVGDHCELKKPSECKFKKVCFKNTLCDGSILEYINKKYAFGGKDTGYDSLSVYDLLNQGCYKIDSIPKDYLGKKVNQIQYDCYVCNKTFINEEKITLAIKSLKYPLYHLDFESYGCPFPRYEGEKPYTQSLFQYSLHIEKEPFVCDKEKDHYEFLAKDHSDCRRELCESLIKNIDLSNGGTVIVYNEAFEKTRLKELAKIYPDLAEDLLNIRDHVFDLLFVLKGNSKMFYPLLSNELDSKEKEELAKEINYYHNNLHGSYSIKKVLPIFTDLSYANLEVHNGTEAVYVYGLLPTLTDKEYEEKYLALRKYCQQDTWAMVEVLWGLRREFNI